MFADEYLTEFEDLITLVDILQQRKLTFEIFNLTWKVYQRLNISEISLMSLTASSITVTLMLCRILS